MAQFLVVLCFTDDLSTTRALGTGSRTRKSFKAYFVLHRIKGSIRNGENKGQMSRITRRSDLITRSLSEKYRKTETSFNSTYGGLKNYSFRCCDYWVTSVSVDDVSLLRDPVSTLWSGRTAKPVENV